MFQRVYLFELATASFQRILLRHRCTYVKGDLWQSSDDVNVTHVILLNVLSLPELRVFNFEGARFKPVFLKRQFLRYRPRGASAR